MARVTTQEPEENSVEHILAHVDWSPDIRIRASAVKDLVRRIEEAPVDTREALAEISTLNAFGYSILRDYFPAEYKHVIPDWKPRRLLREVREALRDLSAERYAALPTNLEDRFPAKLAAIASERIRLGDIPSSHNAVRMMNGITHSHSLPRGRPLVGSCGGFSQRRRRMLVHRRSPSSLPVDPPQ